MSFHRKAKGERMMKSMPLAPGVRSVLLIAEKAPNSALASLTNQGAGASAECLFASIAVIGNLVGKGGGADMG